MIKWTTPRIEIAFEKGDFDNYKEIAVTLQDKCYKVTLTDLDIEGDTLSFSLSQSQSARLSNETKLQVNVLYEDGTRSASQIFNINFKDNLLTEVMS